jgi:BlaI family transcriptional regulator, penicillinase repressor
LEPTLGLQLEVRSVKILEQRTVGKAGGGQDADVEAKQTLTPLELEIMQVLWEVGPSTVSEVQPRLQAELAYTTVQTMLNVLLRKRKVTRAQEGRAFRYRPAVSRERATGSALSDLVKRMFGGSSEALLMAMVDTRQITAEELTRVAERLSAAEPDSEGAGNGRARRAQGSGEMAGEEEGR